MPLTRKQKEGLVTELENAVKNSDSVVFVNFKGIKANENNSLRDAMYNAGVKLKVVKKTLLNRVLDAVTLDGERPQLDGEIAIAYAKDLMSPAREVYAFQKGNAERWSIVGGIFEGKFMNQASMTEIATIPSQQVLRGMFVNVINSPIQGLVVALGQIAEKKQA